MGWKTGPQPFPPPCDFVTSPQSPICQIDRDRQLRSLLDPHLPTVDNYSNSAKDVIWLANKHNADPEQKKEQNRFGGGGGGDDGFPTAFWPRPREIQHVGVEGPDIALRPIPYSIGWMSMQEIHESTPLGWERCQRKWRHLVPVNQFVSGMITRSASVSLVAGGLKEVQESK